MQDLVKDVLKLNVKFKKLWKAFLNMLQFKLKFMANHLKYLKLYLQDKNFKYLLEHHRNRAMQISWHNLRRQELQCQGLYKLEMLNRRSLLPRG
jgi:uncharacterized membrane protein YgaE (UPF0421/DUF939 family)